MLSLKGWQPPLDWCRLCQFELAAADCTSHVAIVCHPDCVKLAIQKRYQLSLATAYAYEPSVEERKRRVAWLRSNLASDLTLSRKLPREIQQMIAQHLLREYAVLKAMSCLLSLRRPTNICVDVSAEVWASYTEYEGIEYISDLANRPSPSEDYKVIFVPDPVQRVDCIYVCEDHLGVRQICFSSGENVPPATLCSGVWWRTLQLPSLKMEVRGKTDGIKLRDISCSKPIYEPHFVSAYSWELPLPRAANIRLYSLSKIEAVEINQFTTFFIFNR
ncbi:hypothetical protein GGR53DRAFT_398989 [Hypoxylon sp. FL1150]|nr:hypothetical protein GGR53DRAFT_398989 [Hypoxylon sp. FL1150]